MPERIPDDSVGLVEAQSLHFNEPIKLVCGRSLPEYNLVFETYGTLNAAASNAVLICHALSGDQHAAGYNSMEDRKTGWWDNYIGPGKPIDSEKFFIVSANNLGGCKGSTGPNTINPETGELYGPDFPFVTVEDWVNSQQRLGRALGIKQWAAVIGGSLGGMQALQWGIQFPDQLRHALIIAAAPKLSAQNIAFNEVARQAILSDPEFFKGYYYKHDTVPRRGLMLARMLGHITYLSDVSMREKFDRELREGKLNFDFDAPEFQVESYLLYQGKSFVHRFDANTYLLMTKTLDYFDPASHHEHDLVKALAPMKAKSLVISFSSDWRFSSERSREIVQALLRNRKRVSYVEIEENQGHDAFLLKNAQYIRALGGYLQHVADEANILNKGANA
jgi:homoserine O-acetyltransferase